MDWIDGAVYVGWGLTVLAGVLYWNWRKPASASDLVDQVWVASDLTRTYVRAAEQLWATGRLPKDVRLDWVVQQVAPYVPGLSHDQLVGIIEAAVVRLKAEMADSLTE